jgi:hypothetical protein
MKVTLAYPYTTEDGATHQPDTTIELGDDLAKQLVKDGKARTPDKTAAPSKTKE